MWTNEDLIRSVSLWREADLHGETPELRRQRDEIFFRVLLADAPDNLPPILVATAAKHKKRERMRVTARGFHE